MEAPLLKIHEDIKKPPIQTIKLKPSPNLHYGDVVNFQDRAFGIVTLTSSLDPEKLCFTPKEYVALPLEDAQNTIDFLIQRGLRPKFKAVVDLNAIAS